MSMRLLILLALARPALSLKVEATSSLSFDVEAAKNRPVAKVITLLKDMQKQLVQEGEEDEEIYEKMACWCETNEKEKTKSIKEAKAQIEDLNTMIEELTASSARINNEIKMLEKDIAKNQAALDTATAIRQKELGEFRGEEKDLLGSIGALNSAIVVLSKHHGGAALLQATASNIVHAATIVEHEMQTHTDLLNDVLTPKQKKTIRAFVQDPSYAPASGEILGILKQMKEEFESNLSNGQKEELQSAQDYSDLKAAKTDEIAASSDQLELKTQELATTDQKNADAKENLEDTEKSLAADEKFLANLKEQCEGMDKEFEERSKARAEEIAAVGKALTFLTSDDAQALFAKTFNAAFVQRQGVSLSKRRAQASQLLMDVARQHNNPKLVALALSVRLDAFTKVKKAVQEMIDTLLKEKEDEIKQKEFCRDGLNENLRKTEDKEREKKVLTQTIEDLTMTIDELTKAVETLKSEIAEMHVQVRRAGEDREKENTVFQETVADQRATIKLLTQALEVLKGFYAKENAFLQANKQEPPVKFKTFQKNENSNGVMSMIQQIITDAKVEEAQAINAERDSQKAYESFVKDTNASIEEKTKEIINKTEEKAKAEDEKNRAEQDLEGVVSDLEQLSSENADLHKACDFIMKNFEIRQTGRDQEIEALKQVLQILSGAKFSQFLQNTVAFSVVRLSDAPPKSDSVAASSTEIDALAQNPVADVESLSRLMDSV